LNCPVCPQAELPAGAAVCPNCGVELAPLRRVEQLPERYLNEALALAGRGDSAQAVAKVAAAIELGAPPVRSRLLLGKLLWNLGRVEEARDCWRRVLEADAENAEARRLLENSEATASGAASPSALPLILAGVFFLAFFILLAAHLTYRGTHSLSKDEVASIRRSTPALRHGTGLGDLHNALRNHNAVSLVQEGDRLKVQFREGLFRGGSDQLVPEAESRLRALASALESNCRGCRVLIEGVADSTPLPRRSRWGTNSALGLARAGKASAVMRSANPSTQLDWLAITSGQLRPPFPNDTPENRGRNRTVVLLIWRPVAEVP
jgi:flagellar motor protein MotB